MNSFSSFHPTVLLLYYVVVIVITTCTMNPIVIGCSVMGSLLFFMVTNLSGVIIKELAFYSLVFLLIAITNLLFVHNGETILFFMNDNPITFEAGISGIVLAFMIIAIIFWNKSYSEVMSSDKVIFLFGKAIPRLAIFISILFRIMPMFKKQFVNVNQAQKALGFYTSDSMTDRLFGGFRVFKSTWIWALEHAFSKSDSMKARGYGLKGRTNFSIFKWQRRDVLLFIYIFTLGVVFIGAMETFYFYYYPVMANLAFSLVIYLQYIGVFLLMVVPSIVEIKENIQWRFLRSRI